MDKINPTIHFISGLPRSGSTLLAAILRQNPAFTAGISTPLCRLVCSNVEAMSERLEGSVMIDDLMRERILKGLFEAYYPTDGTVFDTNRGWCAHMPLISRLFPLSTVICCVRNIPEILDSIEQLAARNTFQPSGLFGYSTGGTIYTRVERLMGANGMVSYACDALREACFGPHANKLLLARYSSLCLQPKETLDLIYHTLGCDPFEHTFDNVTFDADEYDRRLGTPGLHRVRPRVELIERTGVLPPDLVERYREWAFWDDPEGRGGARII